LTAIRRGSATRTGNERYYEKVAPVFFAHLHPANIRITQNGSDIRPRILAGSSARREREAKQFGR
jgi:hypothetical protein